MVSAWKEMVATELKLKEPIMPTKKAKDVGSAANPKLSAKIP
jgi:hypothetical protein